MKELSIEEKSKPYDEAIKKAKAKIKNDKNHVLYEDDIIEIFSTLKESNDERIRKEIINYFECQSRDEPTRKNILNKWINWLKSIKASSINNIDKSFIDDIKNIIYEAPGVLQADKNKLVAWLEKQSEQGNNEDEAILHRFSFYSYKDEPNILYLAGLYVNDEYRNKGIGTKILKIADEVAVSMKCSSILLKTEIGSNAERLYKNNGYNVFRREENQVWLEKQVEHANALIDKLKEK